MYGYEKNERANITDVELEALRKLASELLKLTVAELNNAVEVGELLVICHDC